ncbi:ABC transporter ATP-binding protein [Candidatus Saccharibacteria bacterium]|nr:ABC transporter ATP-binding protein [Candidatus Saccharibacteria bacterium]
MFKLLKYLKPYWWQVLILLASVALQTWSTLQLPALMSEIVNKGIVTGDTADIWSTGGLMLVWVALSVVGAVLSSFFSSRVGTAVARDMRTDLYEKILSFSFAEIDKFSTASLITRTTNDVIQVQQTMVMILSMLLRAPMMAITAIFQAIATAPNMTWIIALAVVVVLALVILILAIVMPKFKIFQQLLDKITLLTRENLTGLRVIRAFNNEKLEKRKFEAANSEITGVYLFINKVMALTSPLIMFVFNGTTLLCIWVGISLMQEDISYLGDMMAFMQYAIQVIMSFLFLTVLFVILPRANVSASRINTILHTRPKVIWPKKTVGTPEKTSSVEFKKVSFAYAGAEVNALENISFKAVAGETVAFIGSTGSGKSTLVNLVPRLYDATAGTVLVDGLDVKAYEKDDLMRRLGYVPQRAVLFSGNVKSNITFGNLTATPSEIEQAAKISQAKEFIEKLEEQYNSHIAQGGTNVSGGQKQRLSIARAVAKNPEIYIFDDSFSALDLKTDAKLRRELKTITKNAVVLIVAQRVSTIKDADQIIVLDEGRVVGKGKHSELLETCAVYREIVQSQFSDQEYQAEVKAAKKEQKDA